MVSKAAYLMLLTETRIKLQHTKQTSLPVILVMVFSRNFVLVSSIANQKHHINLRTQKMKNDIKMSSQFGCSLVKADNDGRKWCRSHVCS